MLFTFEFNSRFINEVELLFLYYHKHSKLKQSALLNFLLRLNLYYKQSCGSKRALFSYTSTSAIYYYCLVYLKVLFSFKPSKKAIAHVLTVKHSRF